MSLIACTGDCVYQRDGYCLLERALSCGQPSKQNVCVNFVPRSHPAAPRGAGKARRPPQ